MELIKIADGVTGLFIENNRFSTTHISINLYLPLKKESIAVNALLPFVLSSCCEKYPDFSTLNLKLSQLYGADVGGIADKSGDTQVLRFFSYFIDDESLPKGEKIAEKAIELLLSMLFDPSVKDGSFIKEDLERERRLTLEKIEGMSNDKRVYAINKILSEMYKNEAFGELKTGSYEAVSAITEKELFLAWQNVLSQAEIRVQVIGKKLPTGLFSRLEARLSDFERKPKKISKTVPKTPNSTVNRICENMEVAQGKLVMGFCTDLVGSERETAFLTVFADLFGGAPYSKLFMNVREKLSLCYYCAARPNRKKGYLLVDSGVEPKNAKLAEEEILNQLEEMKKGNITDEELASSISSIKDSLSCLNDSQAALDGWYAVRYGDELITPEEYSEIISKVTKEDVVKAAGLYTLDTVYKIMPKEEGVL